MDPKHLPEIRRELRRQLYLRRAGVMQADWITPKVKNRTGLPVTDAVILAELVYLIKKNHVAASPDPDGGSVIFYELTPDGINFCEANELTD
jgi:hypothetical protein